MLVVSKNSQAIFNDPMPSAHVITITSKSSSSQAKSGLSTGAIIGIAIAAVIVILAAIFGFIMFNRRKRKQQTAELEATAAKRASNRKDPKYEPLGDDAANEMAADGEHRITELETGDRKSRPHGFASELPSPRPVYEMQGDSRYEMMGDTPEHTPRTSMPPSPYRDQKDPSGR